LKGDPDPLERVVEILGKHVLDDKRHQTILLVLLGLILAAQIVLGGLVLWLL